jgi:single-strand DNA-binding protein
MNVFCFSGNITKDIDLRTTTGGKQVANFSIAINEGKDKTLFLNCVAWDKTGELISQYCKKGDRLSGSGKIDIRKWTDKEGKDQWTTEIIVNQFDFPPKRADAPMNDAPMTGSMPSAKDDLDDSAIPF